MVTLLSGLDTPSGIAWHQGSLYLSHFAGSQLDGNGGGTGGTAAISKLANVDSYALQGKVGCICVLSERSLCSSLQ